MHYKTKQLIAKQLVNNVMDMNYLVECMRDDLAGGAHGDLPAEDFDEIMEIASGLLNEF